MFDIGFWELALIGVIALLVVGPERLPALARNVGLWVGRARRYVAHIQSDIEREINAEEMRKLIEAPAHSISEINDVLSGTKSALDEAQRQLSDVEREAGQLEGEIEDALESAEAVGAPAEGSADAEPFTGENTDLLNPNLIQADDSAGQPPATAQPQTGPGTDAEKRHG